MLLPSDASSPTAVGGDSGNCLVDRTVSNTHTSTLRIVAMTIFIFTFAAAALQLICVGVDEVVTFSLERSVVVNASLLQRSPTSSPPVSGTVQLVPAVDVAVGFLQACFGAHCQHRAKSPGVVPFVLAAYDRVMEEGVGLRPASLQQAYTHFVNQFVAGFKFTAQTCSETAADSRVDAFTATITSSSALATFGIAAGSVAVVFQCIALALAAYVAFLLARIDVFSEKSGLYVELEGDMVMIGIHEVGVQYLRSEVAAHAVWEPSLVLALFPCLCIAFVFSLCSMAVGLSLYQRNLRCGSSVCSTYLSAAESFFTALSSVQEGQEETPTYRCARGVSVGTGATAFVLSTLSFFLGVALFTLYFRSPRRAALARHRDALNQLVGDLARARGDALSQQISAASAAQAGVHSSVAAMSQMMSRHVSLIFDSSSFGGGVDPDATPRDGKCHNSPPFVHFSDGNDLSSGNYSLAEMQTNYRGTYAERLLLHHGNEVEPGLEHTLGGRIALLRQRKLLLREEETARRIVEQVEAKAFHSLSKVGTSRCRNGLPC